MQQNPHTPKVCSIITFNYDICVDYAFYNKNRRIRYGLAEAEDQQATPLFKLHGSLNWGSCSECRRIVDWPLHAYFRNRYWELEGRTKVVFPISQKLAEVTHCSGAGKLLEPFVVPPTWNKGQYHNELESVWRAAAKELSTARDIFVCGYSLPDTDQFFRLLYALGTAGTARLRRFWVFDPNPEVGEKFRSLIGSSIKSRFEFFPRPFMEAIPLIRGKLMLS